ncbi:MAG: exonuclease, partial [Armatimonadetes bacterium]|nr:exonuclease [Armatimonadota bacterium]
MLSRTFIHVPGIGPVTERRIWERGCHSWDAFLREPAAAGLSAQKTDRVAETITTSRDNLRRENHRYFSQALPSREHWRS